MRLCKECKKSFSLKNDGHLVCSACRIKKAKKPCVDCGKKVNRNSTRCTGCNNGIGEKNPAWNGGHCYAKNGYVYMYVGKSKYKFEHQLVMEKHIGRKLVEGENVHHINGVKHDNRIENLELWTRPQPSGVRAKELLVWAEKTVSLYRPIKKRL